MSVTAGTVLRRCLPAVLALTLGPLDAFAQQLPLRAYTTADGLPHNSVNRIVRDSRGFLWFCTDNGLARFDGRSFASFGVDAGLPDGEVNDLLETGAGEYWVATTGGLARFDPLGTPRTATPLFSVVKSADSNAFASDVIKLLEDRDGVLWAGTRDGLFRLNRGNGSGGMSLDSVEVGIPREMQESRWVLDLLQDQQGTLWLATPSGLYRRTQSGQSSRYTTKDGLGMPSDYLQDLLEDRDGQLWVGTRTGGFFRVRADASPRAPAIDRLFSYAEGLPSSWVFQLFETAGRRFWIATARGLVEFLPGKDSEARRVRQYSTVNGLSDFNVTGLAEDAAGNLWLGTGSNGAMRLARHGLAWYGERQGIVEAYPALEDRAGHLCVRGSVIGDARTSVFEGARLDLIRGDQPTYHQRFGCFDGRRFDWFYLEGISIAGWSWGWVQDHVTLQTRHGEWWIGTGSGVFRFKATDDFRTIRTARETGWYALQDGLAAPQVYRLFEDSRGDVWVSTISSLINGLARWDRATGRMRDLAGAPGLPSLRDELPRAFAEDASGHVWIGFTGCLVRYGPAGFTLFTDREGLPPGAIKDIHLDREGRLWLASTRSGLIRVDQPGSALPVFARVGIAQGLSSDSVLALGEDRDGNLYAGGGFGMDGLDPATGRIKQFTATDGLSRGTVINMFLDRHGALWSGLTHGLAQLVPQPETAPTPSPMLITGIQVGGAPLPLSALGERGVSLPDFEPDENDLEFQFVALSFATGDVLRYQYRLAGSNADWSLPGGQRTVKYASLTPGRYTFMVRAVSSTGAAVSEPATIAFTILAPVWQRWWFLTSSVIAVGLIGYGLYRYRVARLLEIADIRMRIASDLHDDIGANLTRIALLSEVARRADIARIARESVGSMSDIVWAIKPERESLLDLVRRMRQHGEELFGGGHIDFRFNAPDASHEHLKLTVGVRRDLLLIYKEATSNAARHAQCAAVEVTLRVEASRLVMTIADNGRGFDVSQPVDGQGLASMRRRARNLSAAIDITSVVGTGTMIAVTIPR